MAESEKNPDTERQGQDQSGIELAYASLVLYADDGTIDEEELKTLLHIALRDGVINEREKEVLRSLFNRIHEEEVSAEVWDHIQNIRKQHSI